MSALESASEALERARYSGSDAVVSDYCMPNMDGIAFLEQLRKEDDHIPFIIFTGKGREEVVIEALNQGADLYQQKGGGSKPQFTELTHKLRQAVRQRGVETIRQVLIENPFGALS